MNEIPASYSQFSEDQGSRRSHPVIEKLWRYFELITACLGIVAILLSYKMAPSGTQALRFDAIGYYLYLPAIFLYRDPGMVETCRHVSYGKFETFPLWTGILFQENTGKYLDKYPIGVAILQLPFFVLGHLATWLTGGPRDGVSFYYQLFIAPSGLLYLLIGIHFLKRLLKTVMSSGRSLAVLTCIVYGTNLFNYATFDGTLSHVFSFCLITIFLWRTRTWHIDPGYKQSILVGLVLGMITLVRIPNLSIVLIWALYGVSDKPSLLGKFSLLRKNWRSVVLIFVTCLILLLPQLMYWKYVSDRWLINSYQGESFNFANPQFLNVLFSLRKGLLFWSPILVFAVGGIFFAKRIWPQLWLGVLAYLAFHFYLVSSWHMWHYASGYGHRAFVDDMGLFALLMTAFFAHLNRKWLKRSVVIAASLMIYFNFVQMVQFWKEIIPSWGVVRWSTYKDIFHKFKTRTDFYFEGVALYEAGKIDEAIQKLNTALEMEINSEFHYARGLAWLQKGDFASAFEDFSQVVTLDGDHMRARLMVAGLQEKLGRTEEARRTYSDLIDRAGTNTSKEAQIAHERLQILQGQK